MNQNAETLARIADLGLELDSARNYYDRASGWSPKIKLPERDRLLADAERGDLKGWTLTVRKPARLSKLGIRNVFDVLDRLTGGRAPLAFRVSCTPRQHRSVAP